VKRVVVLDYGSGNLRSAQRALERVGAEVTVTDDTALAADADGLVVPGVGAYAACMAGLHAVGAPDLVAKRVADGRPLLGICVGLQVLFEAGVEHGVESAGLGVLRGRVEALRAPVRPHMGWNTVSPAAGSTLLAGLDEGTRFYFVHSYAAHDTDGLVSTAGQTGCVSATQFHPEKSGDAGAELLRNWLATL
jgi:imidazole glycerol-phosphate synthase subunit HisH